MTGNEPNADSDASPTIHTLVEILEQLEGLADENDDAYLAVVQGYLDEAEAARFAAARVASLIPDLTTDNDVFMKGVVTWLEGLIVGIKLVEQRKAEKLPPLGNDI